jgi:hypothetical protein
VERPWTLPLSVAVARRVIGPLCAVVLLVVVAVSYFEAEARARASTIARESLERVLAADRFEAMLDGPVPGADRLQGSVWIEPGLAGDGGPTAPRRVAGGSAEGRMLLAAHRDARRAFELPGVAAVRLRTAAGPVEIARPIPQR